MILLGSGLLNKAILFYQETIDDSNIIRTTIDLYKARNKPEKAQEWRVKVAQMEDFEE
jgi:hypothetical protein